QAVQTLSRLNRCHPDKKDTCVVDFVNDRQTIYEAFKPYYDVTRIAETTNPNHLYAQQTEILQYGLIRDEEISGFVEIYFQKKPDTGRLDALVQAAVKRFSEAHGPQCPKKAQQSGEAFKGSIRSFLRLYEFVTQLVRFVDVDLEKFYLFVKHLLP
ncbi:type I restriction-modification system restriction subunit, partial [mine drainage metagenome]